MQAAVGNRMTTKQYLQFLYREFKQKYAFWFLLVVLVILLLGRYFSLAFNFSYSLPHHVYLVVKSSREIADFKHGDYVAFNWQGGFYPHGTPFLKRVTGLPGDNVSRQKRRFFINGQSVGWAKEEPMDGMVLEANSFTGTIPESYVWVTGDHRDSLDSRYALTGLISEGQFIGKAYPLF